MKMSFNWENLRKKNCPNILCGKRMTVKRYIWSCEHCGYWLSKELRNELLKGKESKFYKRAVNKYKAIDNFRKERKDKIAIALQAQEKEREYNRRKILQQQTNQ